MAKLYPPHITTSMPAFYKRYNAATDEVSGATIKIPYTMNQGVGYSQIDGFCLRLRNVSSGTYVFAPLYSTDYNMDNDEVIFEVDKIDAAKLEEGQFYRVQLSYYTNVSSEIVIGDEPIIVDKTDPHAAKEIGYFSTVGLIRCVPYPSVTISGYSLDSTNLFTGSFLGVYDITDAIDKTEKVSSYKFNIYDDKGVLYYTTGDLIHNAANDSEYGQSTDTLLIDDFITSKKAVYKIEYVITTKNGLTVASPLYRMTSEQLLAPNKNVEIVIIPNPDEAYMTITFKGESSLNAEGRMEEDNYYGEYVLTRACEEDGYTTWIEMHRFRLQDAKPSSVSFRDFSIKQGVKYKYGLSQYNIWNIVSTRLESAEASIDFEDMFLFDGDRQLKIRFNPKMTKFETTLLEQKTDTIGSKFPYFTRNAAVEYKTFPISGLISCLMDDARLFYKTDYDYIVNRKSTETEGKEDNRGFFDHYSLTEENILRERNFKLEVLDWLNNGKPKMFKSATEGNYIVRLMKVSLKPTDKLGRMLHTFSCTAYEVADFTYDNLLKLGFVNKSEISRYVSLWKTYNFADWGSGQDIVIEFESNISEFLIQDLLPGTKVELYQKNVDTPLEIIIGTTGSYRFSGSNQRITRLVIPASPGERFSGTIECQYDGLRYSDFDAIKDIKLKTIVSHQFIGNDPNVTNIHFQSINKQFNIETLKSINQRLWINKTNLNSETRELEQILQIGPYQNFKEGFLPTDIIQSIKTDIYNFKKSKVKILNMENAKFQLRDLIPIYKVPYQYLPEATKTAIKRQYTQNDIINDLENLYNSSHSKIKFSSYRWSVTPFGQPYPIDKMTPIMSDDAIMNDPFCIFELFEYNGEDWQHFTGKWQIGGGADNTTSYSGFYYDAYWAKRYMIKNNLLKARREDQLDGTAFVITDIYDPTFFINDRVMYVPISNDLVDGEELTLNECYNRLYSDETNLWIKAIDNTYSRITATDDKTFEDVIKDSDVDAFYYQYNYYSGISQVSTYQRIPANVVKDYFNNKDFYLNGFYVKDRTGKYVSLKDADIDTAYLNHIFCTEERNQIDLSMGREMEFNNLGEVTELSIGNGVMVSLTFQLQIIDYFTEDNNKTVQAAKQKYLVASEYLRNIFEDYENIANADNDYCKYSALYNIYTKLVFGSDSNDTKTLTPLQHLMIIALLNIEKVPRAVLESIIASIQSSGLKQQVESLYNQNKPDYDFEVVLNMIEPDVNRQNILLRLYYNPDTLQSLNIMDTIEYAELQKALTIEDFEGMADKIHKLSNILDEVTIRYNELEQEQNKIVTEFEDTKSKIEAQANSYNKALRQWLMALFLIETQLHRWGQDNSLGPYSLSDIAAYYKNESEQLEQDINTGAQNETLWLAKAENIYQELLLVLDELYTYEKIKADRSDDELLDDYITSKEYENIEELFVKLYQLYLVKEQYAASNVGELLSDLYRKQAYPAVIGFFGSTIAFSSITNTISNTLEYSVEQCLNARREFLSYYPDKDSISDIVYDDIVEASKEALKKYIFAMDNFDYSTMYYLTALSVYLNNELRNKINTYRNTIIVSVRHLLSTTESNLINDQRPQISFEVVGNYVNPYTQVKKENLALNVDIYFSTGVDWSQYGAAGSATRKQQERIEEKSRVDELLKIIEMIQGRTLVDSKPKEIIDSIESSLLSEQGFTPASLRKIIFTGFTKNGLLKMVKDFNSRIEYYRQGWLSKMPATINYQTDLVDGEFIPALSEYNQLAVQNNREPIKVEGQYLNNFAESAKYNLINTVLFNDDRYLSIVVSKKPGESALTALEKITSERDIVTTRIDPNVIVNQNIENLYASVNKPHLALQTKTIYANKTLEIYNLNSFIPYVIGHSFILTQKQVKTGILYWYIKYNILPTMEYYMQLIEQSTKLLGDYTNRQSNYAVKCSEYDKLQQNALAIYNSYNGTDQMEYYKEPSSSKEAKIDAKVQAMQNAWDDFILALDKAYTDEVERGMYI